MDIKIIVEIVAALLVLVAFIIFGNVHKRLKEQETKLMDEQLFKDQRKSIERNRNNRIENAKKASDRHRQLKVDDANLRKKIS